MNNTENEITLTGGNPKCTITKCVTHLYYTNIPPDLAYYVRLLCILCAARRLNAVSTTAHHTRHFQTNYIT